MDSPLYLNSLSISNGSHQYEPAIVSRSAIRAPISIFIDKHLDRILYLASTDEDFCAKDPAHKRAKVARAASQVCRRWRATALNIPSIWLGPVLSWFSRPSWLEIVLERSKPLPFDAFIPRDALRRNPQILQVILEHLPRIRHLDLTLGPLLWQSVTKSGLLLRQAPCLQAFSLNVTFGIEARRQIHVSEQENLFGGWAPMLRHLHVQNCPINLAPKMYSSLRGLSLDMTHFMSPIQLLDVLRNMKYLESLYLLRSPGNPHLIIESPDVSPVYLLNLKELQISDSISMCAGILKNLRLPSSCSIRIGCYHAYDGQHLREILSHIKDSLFSWRCDPLTGRQSLHIGATHIKFTIAGPNDDGWSNRDHPFISLALSWQPSPTSLDTLFSVFPPVTSTFRHCSAPPHSLLMQADAKMPAELRPLISKWLRKMKDIQAVDFQTHDAFALLEPLLRPPRNNTDIDDDYDDDYDPPGEVDILLPFLGDLTFVGINFTADKRRYWKRLMKTLKRRDRAGCPVQQIDFVKCVGDFNLNESSRYVAEVKVNGQYCNDSNDGDEDSADDSDYTIQANSDIE